MHLVGALGLAARQHREVADELLAVERPDEVLADLDLGVVHLLREVGGAVVLAGVLDHLDGGQER